jgi:cobalt-zinc-cadmium resistance protein CzcA
MTAATTSLGLIPLLFSQGTGSEVQRPLATVVVGGLVTSTVLTLLVLPALYKWFSVEPAHEAVARPVPSSSAPPNVSLPLPKTGAGTAL